MLGWVLAEKYLCRLYLPDRALWRRAGFAELAGCNRSSSPLQRLGISVPAEMPFLLHGMAQLGAVNLRWPVPTSETGLTGKISHGEHP